MDSTEVSLDGNTLGSLQAEIFLGRHRLSTVRLNHSSITHIGKGSLQGLQGCTHLYLHHNMLELLLGEEFQDTPNLEVLTLHNNLLTTIGETTFSQLTHLRSLTLQHNRLTSLSVPVGLVMVSVQHNPWLCSCSLAITLERLQGGILSGGGGEVCTLREGGKDTAYITELASSCKERSVLAVSSPTQEGVGLVLVVVILVVVVVVVIVVVVTVGLLLVYKGNRRQGEEDTGLFPAVSVPPRTPNTSQYSAYLHYCLADSLYVQQRLAPALEEASPGSRLCLHHRDLLTTTTVGQALALAVKQSRCLIILASQSYFESSIPTYELQMILSEVLLLENYPVVVMTKEEISPTRDKLRHMVGSQADSWTYQPLNSQLHSWEQQLGPGSITSCSGSSSDGSCTTRSTGLSSPGMRSSLQSVVAGGKLGATRLIENPLDTQYVEPLLGDIDTPPAGPAAAGGGGGARRVINTHRDVVRLRHSEH